MMTPTDALVLLVIVGGVLCHLIDILRGEA